MPKLNPDDLPDTTEGSKFRPISVNVTSDFYAAIEKAAKEGPFAKLARGNISGYVRLVLARETNFTGDIGKIKDKVGGAKSKEGDMLYRAIMNSDNERLKEALKSGNRQTLIDLLTQTVK